jgi:hypothetical protein
MFKWVQHAGFAEYGSAALVFVSAAIVGHEAAVGMNQTQWLGAAAAVLGSIGVAVMVHVWPTKPRSADAAEKARRE